MLASIGVADLALLQLLSEDKKVIATAYVSMRRPGRATSASTPPNRNRNRPAVQPLPVAGMPHLRNRLLYKTPSVVPASFR